MDSITFPTAHDRAIVSSCKHTGAFQTTRSYEDGVTTFSAKNRAGDTVVSGKVLGDGEVKYAKKPDAAREAAREKREARKAAKASA